jgi:hypothetical protein
MLTITHNSSPPPSLEFTHDSTTRQLDATLARQDPFKLLEKLPWMMPWMYPRAETKSTRDSSSRSWSRSATRCQHLTLIVVFAVLSCCWALHIWKFCFLEVLNTVSASERFVGIWKFSGPWCCSLRSMNISKFIFCRGFKGSSRGKHFPKEVIQALCQYACLVRILMICKEPEPIFQISLLVERANFVPVWWLH